MAQLGDLVRVILRGKGPVEDVQGRVFASSESVIVLQDTNAETMRSNVRVVNKSHMERLEVLEAASQSTFPEEIPSFFHKDGTLPEVEHDKLARRLAEEVQRQRRRIGPSVTPAAQAVFDSLAENVDCQWDGTTIVVHGSVRVQPPYTARDVEEAPNQERLVKRVTALLSE